MESAGASPVSPPQCKRHRPGSSKPSPAIITTAMGGTFTVADKLPLNLTAVAFEYD